MKSNRDMTKMSEQEDLICPDCGKSMKLLGHTMVVMNEKVMCPHCWGFIRQISGQVMCNSCKEEMSIKEVLRFGSWDVCPRCWHFHQITPIPEFKDEQPQDDPVERFWAWLFVILLICAMIGLCIGKAACNL